MRRPLLRILPEPRLALVLVLVAPLWLLPGIAGRITALVALGVAALAALVDAVVLPTAGDLIVERAVPASIGIGDRAPGEYVVRSRWRLPLRATLADDFPTAVTGGAVDSE